MGLLSDPSLAPRNKLGRNLAKHNRKICFLIYLAGLVWFVCLAHPNFNHNTYLSETALSPGLAYPEIKQDTNRLAQSLLAELKRERDVHKSNTPYSWIVAKMKQIGLETYIHNFTLRYPLSENKEYHGKNIYGILRAPRIGSTEGVVFTAPYRSASSVHTDITAGVPLLLAFADFARKKNYWAKNLVFLITEQEQLGMQAWLEAYHEGNNHDPAYLDCGSLPARAGALQAALNLEIQDLDIDYIDVKIEGLNGQLPNLDMFNLVQRITTREGILSGYMQSPRKKRRSSHSTLSDNLKHMTMMLVKHATGVPNGNHGLFHRYRVESLTIEAIQRSSNINNNKNSAALPLLKTLEGISRSLNNLLERFHQSYFFYILVQNDRFVSIGDFMPCLILLSSCMFIKAFLLWLTLDCQKGGESERGKTESKSTIQFPYAEVIYFIGFATVLGVLCNIIPLNQFVRNLFFSLDISVATSISILLSGIVLLSFIFPLTVDLSKEGMELLHIAALIFLGVTLTVVGLLNFALGFLVAVFFVPVAILISTDPSDTFKKSFSKYYTLMMNPLVVVFLIVLVLTRFQFVELTTKELVIRAVYATMDAITFAFMDKILYSNWLYAIVTAVFLPLWTLFWKLSITNRVKDQYLETKTD